MGIDVYGTNILIIKDSESDNELFDVLIKNRFTSIRRLQLDDEIGLDQNEAPNLILINAPNVSNKVLAIVHQLKTHSVTCDIPVVIFLENNITFIKKCLEAGVNDYLLKPLDSRELLNCVVKQILLSEIEQKRGLNIKQIRKSLSAKNKIYSIIAHDLRSPISSLKMMLDLLVSRLTPESIGVESYEILNLANEITEESFSLLDNLLKWTKNETGDLSAALQKIDLVPLAKDVISIYRSIAATKGISINFKSVKQANVRVDVDMIKTCMRNLMSNAVKFSHNNGIVNVSIDEDSSAFIFSVEDFGFGIGAGHKLMADRLDIDEILSSDFSFDTESGLGLLLTKNFIFKNGGVFWFESKEGIGSKFYFSIPKS